MKQIFTLAVAAILALSAEADYKALLFKTADGESHSIGINGLEISFWNETLTANDSKTLIILPLVQVESMEFIDSSDPGAVETIVNERLSEKTIVYDLNGKNIGVYPSFSDALDGITSGVYLFRYTDGTTIKIVK